MRVLVTDAAGFLGFHLLQRLRADGHEVVGAIGPDFHPQSAARLARLESLGFTVRRAELPALLAEHRPDTVVHLSLIPRNELPDPQLAARQAGLDLGEFGGLLGAGCAQGVKHVVLGSGAGVYGAGEKLPFAVDTPLHRPLGMCAATERAAELFAHAFAHAHGLPVTVLRFFSLYGPWGNDSQAPMRFARALLSREPVPLPDGGALRRDFVYVDDAVEVLSRAVERIPEGDPEANDAPPFAVHNVGTGNPSPLMRVLELVEARLGRAAQREEIPLPRTSLNHTWADVRELQQAYGFRPSIALAEGVARTVDWMLSDEAAAWRPDGA